MTATVALTGGTGFLGGAIARTLAENGYRLRLLVRRPAAMPDLPPDTVAVLGSLGNRDSLARLLEGADAVVHAAGAIKTVHVEEFDLVNREGASAMADAALKARVERFVLISSIAARAPLVSAYAGSKRAGEAEVLSRLGAGVAIFRPPVVYGPGDRETLPMFRAARFGLFPIPGPPEARLSFIHVADLAAAVAAAIGAPKQPVGIFEIDDGTLSGYGWPEIAAALGAAVGRVLRQVMIPVPALRAAARLALVVARLSGKPLMLRPDKVNELRHPDWVCRDSRLTEATGWRPRFSLADGFRDAVAWYRGRGWL